jgi:hypothetical protein
MEIKNKELKRVKRSKEIEKNKLTPFFLPSPHLDSLGTHLP